MVDPNVSYNKVHASRGKVIRAEPVAALYEQGRIHHVGAFPTLEDQQCAFTTDFDRKAAGFSPDRVDALVWAMSDLLVEPMPNEGHFEYMRQRAAALNSAATPLSDRESPLQASFPRNLGLCFAPKASTPSRKSSELPRKVTGSLQRSPLHAAGTRRCLHFGKCA